MTQDHIVLCGPTRVWDPVRPIGPVLIQVPALSSSSQHWRRTATRTAVRRRRRLRREVRLAGTAFLLFVVPLAWGILTVGRSDAEQPAVSARLTGIEIVSPSFAAADESSRVTGPTEPSAAAPGVLRERQTPVVLPGYVLPDDGSEEPAHAGS
jgi:hypothetical protein